MEQKKIISLGAVLVAALAVIGLATVSLAAADNQNSQPANKGQGQKWQANHEEMMVKKQAIETALANDDYQAWVQAVGTDSLQASKITADNFPQLVNAYQLESQARDLIYQARQIREQLGLKGLQVGKGSFHGRFRNFKEPLKTE